MNQQPSTGLIDMRAFRNHFAGLYDNAVEKMIHFSRQDIDSPEHKEDEKTLFVQIEKLCNYTQSLIDLNYDEAMPMLFTGIQPKDDLVTSAYLYVGAILLSNLDKMERKNPEKARTIRDNIVIELDNTHEEISKTIIRNVIHFIVSQRANEGWDEKNLSRLQWDLTQEKEGDAPRITAAKKQMRALYFPRVTPSDEMIRNSASLFADKNGKVSDDDIRKLPMLSLFYHSFYCVAGDENGYIKRTIEDKELVPLSKSLYALYDMDADFTARFVGNTLLRHSPENAGSLNYLLADFLDQTSNYAFSNRLIDDKTYKERKKIAQKHLSQARQGAKYNASLANLLGLISEREETKQGIFMQEQGKYLSPFKGDSTAQIKAKNHIALHLMPPPSPK